MSAPVLQDPPDTLTGGNAYAINGTWTLRVPSSEAKLPRYPNGYAAMAAQHEAERKQWMNCLHLVEAFQKDELWSARQTQHSFEVDRDAWALQAHRWQVAFYGVAIPALVLSVFTLWKVSR